MFDAQNFLQTNTEGEMSTEYVQVPPGEWTGEIQKIDARTQESQSGDEFHIMDITWAIQDDQVKETTGMDNPTVRQSVFLDLTESGGLALGKGKNVQLGRLREAVGQNGPGAWAPSMLYGARAKVKVDHNVKDDRTYVNVTSVAPLS